MTTRHIRLDLFGTDYTLVTTVAEYQRVCRRLGGSDTPVNEWDTMGMVCPYHSGDGSEGPPVWHAVIAVDEQIAGDPIEWVKLIVHEATHAAAMTLDHIAEKYDGGSETLAHLTAFLAAWIYQHTTP